MSTLIEAKPLGEHPRQPVAGLVDDEPVLVSGGPRMAGEIAADHLAVGVGTLQRVGRGMEADERLARADPGQKSIDVGDRQFARGAGEDHAVEGGERLGGEGLGEPRPERIVGLLLLGDPQILEVEAGRAAAEFLEGRLGNGDRGVAEAARHRHEQQPLDVGRR